MEITRLSGYMHFTKIVKKINLMMGIGMLAEIDIAST
jgi:hypothetical protein